jgi:hypothetical protein
MPAAKSTNAKPLAKKKPKHPAVSDAERAETKEITRTYKAAFSRPPAHARREIGRTVARIDYKEPGGGKPFVFIDDHGGIVRLDGGDSAHLYLVHTPEEIASSARDNRIDERVAFAAYAAADCAPVSVNIDYIGTQDRVGDLAVVTFRDGPRKGRRVEVPLTRAIIGDQ